MRSLFLLLAGLALAGCTSGDHAPVLSTPADSLAMSMMDASGGWDAWAALPLVRFDWVFERDSVESFRARHIWDRAGQRARVEWPVGEDSVAVALLNLETSTPEAPMGAAYINGVESSPADSLIQQAYSRFINDTYWLLPHLKVFDPGVNRALTPDSSAQTLALSFGEVGLTPGDRYWLGLNASGDVERWTYILEGDTTSTTWMWSAPEALSSPSGPISVYTRKTNGAGAAILTIPRTDVPADAWTATTPVLQ